MTTPRRSPASLFAVVFGLWTVVGFFFASQLYVLWPVTVGRSITFAQALAINLPFYYLWSLLTPLILWLARRFPLERGRWIRSLAVHGPTSLVLSSLQLLVAHVLLFASHSLDMRHELSSFSSASAVFFRENFHANFLTYWGVVSLAWTYDYYRRFRERELQASELRTRLVQAELSALKMQLHPHFVFNTLNAIAALIPKRPVAAEQMVVELSEFLRLTLHNAGREQVTLDEEIRFLRRYLKIEETRFGDRLSVAYELDPAALEAEVPNLILQPLVENAIRHGLAPIPGPGHLVVRARRAWDSLILEVVDNGRGFAGGAAPPEGIGLSNVRGRLRHLYGGAASLELRSGEDEGLAVVLTLPFRTTAAPAPVSEGSGPSSARLLLHPRTCTASEMRGEAETVRPFPRTSTL